MSMAKAISPEGHGTGGPANSLARNSGLVGAALMALLSSTARPAQKGLDRLTQLGFPPEVAELTLHLAPIIGAGIAIWGIVLLSGRWKLPARIATQALAGLVCGMLLGFCLDVFAGSAAALKAWTGPLGEARPAHVWGWVAALLCVLWGMALLSIRVFGKAAVEMLAARPVHAAQAQMSKTERPNFTRAGAGMVITGIALGTVTLLNQAQAAPDAVRAALGAGFVLASALLAYLQWAMFHGMDELQRRATIEAYALSGILATCGLAVAAGLAPFGLLPALGAYELLLGFFLLQTVGTVFVASKRMAQSTCAEEGDA